MPHEYDSVTVATDMLMVAAITNQPYDQMVGYIVIGRLNNGQSVIATNGCCIRHAVGLTLDILDSSGPACTSPQASLN